MRFVLSKKYFAGKLEGAKTRQETSMKACARQLSEIIFALRAVFAVLGCEKKTQRNIWSALCKSPVTSLLGPRGLPGTQQR